MKGCLFTMKKLLAFMLILSTIACLSVWAAVFIVYSDRTEYKKKDIPLVNENDLVYDSTEKIDAVEEPQSEMTTKEEETNIVEEPELKKEVVEEKEAKEQPKDEVMKEKSTIKTYRLYEVYYPDFYAWLDNVSGTDVSPPVYQDYELDQYYISFVEEHFTEVQNKLFSLNRYFQHFSEELPTNGTNIDADEYELNEKASIITDLALNGMSEPYTYWLTEQLGESYKAYLEVVERYMYHIRITIDDGMFEPTHTYDYTTFFRNDIEQLSKQVQKNFDEAKLKLKEEKERIDNGQVILD